ncbi:polyubiquitin-like [Electrophorus electricus]|uniref:polyubiquitin-like n=1 Tax=Electrophorus electricus TaxID=8005 RepID=UPI0015D053A9|nr:polyubiquitin-like [Electrophorus electricus]XP_026882972.2 polyubiquitin-like [Electrophorus electricus]
MMELIIKGLTGEPQTVTVTVSTTVGELKQLIAQRFQVPPLRQKLCISNGHTIHLDNDLKTVSAYGLSSGTSVSLLILSRPVPFQVFIKNEKGQTETYDVTEDETVDSLQRKIFNKQRTPGDQQRLIYSGRQLESKKKLKDYDITSGSTIYMTLCLRGG